MGSPVKSPFWSQEGNFSNQVTSNMCDTFFGPAKRPERLEMIRKLSENFTEEKISAKELLYIYAYHKIFI